MPRLLFSYCNFLIQIENYPLKVVLPPLHMGREDGAPPFSVPQCNKSDYTAMKEKLKAIFEQTAYLYTFQR